MLDHIKLHPIEQKFNVLMTQWKWTQGVGPCEWGQVLGEALIPLLN